MDKSNIEAINKFRDEKDLLITYAELEKIPLNETIQMIKKSPGAIECIRITSRIENTLMFTVSMKANQVWEQHHHDCDETTIVFRGRLRDILNDKEAGIAESLFYKKKKSHFVVAMEDSVFYVEFKKPN